MPSPNEAKLEELREEALSMDDGYKAVCLAFVNRAFQIGRMEQHERDTKAVNKWVYDPKHDFKRGDLFPVLEAIASVSPVEGEE